MSRRSAPNGGAPGMHADLAHELTNLRFDRKELNAKSEWEKVGEGSFGHVYKARWFGKSVAVKEASSTKQSRIDAIQKDILYLSRYPHPNIVQILGWWEEDGMIFVVMEFLHNSLRDKRCVNKVNLVSVLADVARALVKLHGAGHLHRDVKARNVLVSADFRVAKLADFGLARHVPPSGSLTPRIGPRKYRAPEVESGGDYGVSADMYSFGVMIAQLLEQLRTKTARKYGPTVEYLKALSRACLRRDPSRRPTAMDALESLQGHLGRPIQRDGPPSRWHLAQGGAGERRSASPDPSSSSSSESDSRGGRRSGSPSGSQGEAEDGKKRGRRRERDRDRGRAEGEEGEGGRGGRAGPAEQNGGGGAGENGHHHHHDDRRKENGAGQHAANGREERGGGQQHHRGTAATGGGGGGAGESDSDAAYHGGEGGGAGGDAAAKRRRV